jgi:hypothetical protein
MIKYLIVGIVSFGFLGISLKKENILGTWDVVDFEGEIREASRELIDAGRKESLSSVYVFKKDNSFRLTSNYLKEGVEGSFKVFEDERVLRIIYKDETTQEFDILMLENGTMKLKTSYGEMGYTVETLKRR